MMFLLAGIVDKVWRHLNMQDRRLDSVMIVPIEQVLLSPNGNVGSIRKVKHYLIVQGQIEPMQVKILGDNLYQAFDCAPYDNDRLAAALELGWPTILIAPTEKYEQ